MLHFLSLAGRRAIFAPVIFGVALGVGLAPSTAYAYCRTTTQPLPASYNPASRGCYTQGLLLYWRGACVGYSINQSASKTVPFADAKRIIDAAFATWMSAYCPGTGKPAGLSASDLGTADCDEVRYNQDTANQNLIVFRDDSWPYTDPNNTLGLTTVTFNADTGEIFDADMEINSSGHNLSITSQVPANGFDLASVITHEAGHFLGLAHATSPSSTMFASYKPGTAALRSLSADDVAGFCAIYPDTATRIVSPTPTQPESLTSTPCDATPRHGLTAECVTAPPNQQKCSAASGPAAPWDPTGGAGVTLAAAAVFVVRRGVSRLAKKGARVGRRSASG